MAWNGSIRTFMIAFWLLASAASAPGQAKVTALRATWLIDATGRPPIADAVVLIEGNRITAVGTRASVPTPPGAEIIDLPGQTLLPGLIDTHSHLVLRYETGGVLGLIAQEEGPASEQMVKVVRNARVQLLCGITTLRQVGDGNYVDIVLRDAISAGMHPGPRVISSGELITNTGGHFVSGEKGTDGPDAVRKKVRQNFHRGAEWIKLAQTDVTSTGSQIAPEDLKAAIGEAHRLGMRVTVHATGRWGSAMRTAVEAGADNLEHARPLTDELVALMLKHGTTASLTPLVYIGWRPTRETWRMMDNGVKSGGEWIEYLGREFEAYRKAHPDQETQDRSYEDNEPGRANRDMFQAVKTVQKQYLNAYRAGLPFSLGLDTMYGGLPLEMEFLVEAGIPPMDAIRAATSVSAKLIGYGDRLGTVEKGKWADLISVQGNPIENIRNMRQIRLIMKDGVRYDTLSWK